MDADAANAVNEHLGLAFDHLREAIMLALAGEPTAGGAVARLERFAATGDTEILMEGLDELSLRPRPGEMPEDTVARVVAAASEVSGLFDDEDFSKKAEEPAREYEEAPVEEQEEEWLKVPLTPENLAPDDDEEEEDEFSGLFDDIDEDDDSDDGPADAPAAF
jgi:hypothetical protein